MGRSVPLSENALSCPVSFEVHTVLSSRQGGGWIWGKVCPLWMGFWWGAVSPDVGLPGQDLLSRLLMDLAAGDPSRLVLGEDVPPRSVSQRPGAALLCVPGPSTSDGSPWCH